MKKFLITFLIMFTFSTPAFAKVNIVATLPWIGSLASDIGPVSYTHLTLPTTPYV